MINKIEMFIIRHGQTILNVQSKSQGWSDSPLTKRGVESSHNIGKQLSRFSIESIYSSDLPRCLKTSQIVLSHIENSQNICIHSNPCLRECNYGIFEQELESKLLKKVIEYQGIGTLKELFLKPNPVKIITDTLAVLDKTHKAEYFGEVEDRMLMGINSIIQDCTVNNQKRVLIVTHSNAIIALLQKLQTSDIINIPHDGISKISVREDDQIVVDFVANRSILLL